MTTKADFFNKFDWCEVVKCYEPVFITKHPMACKGISFVHKCSWVVFAVWFLCIFLALKDIFRLAYLKQLIHAGYFLMVTVVVLYIINDMLKSFSPWYLLRFTAEVGTEDMQKILNHYDLSLFDPLGNTNEENKKWVATPKRKRGRK